MHLKKILNKNETNEKFVKMKCVDKSQRIYVLEALCDFEVCGKKVNKGDISGKLILEHKDDSVTLNGKNWIKEKVTLTINGKCILDNSYFYIKNGKIAIKNSSITNSLIYVQDAFSNSSDVYIFDSEIDWSKFIIKTTLSDASRNITVSSSRVKNCNFYTLVMSPEQLYNVDYTDEISLFAIKNSIIVNTTSLKDVSVINSKVNADGYAEKVYIDGEFFVKDSEMKFTTNKAYVDFPRLPYYSAGYLKKNITLKKYTNAWTPRIAGLSYVKTNDENKEKICMRFARCEPEILKSYNLFKMEDEKKRQARKSENEGINTITESAGNDGCKSSDNENLQGNKDAESAKEIELENERNNRLEEVKKKAKELGIEL